MKQRRTATCSGPGPAPTGTCTVKPEVDTRSSVVPAKTKRQQQRRRGLLDRKVAVAVQKGVEEPEPRLELQKEGGRVKKEPESEPEREQEQQPGQERQMEKPGATPFQTPAPRLSTSVSTYPRQAPSSRAPVVPAMIAGIDALAAAAAAADCASAGTGATYHGVAASVLPLSSMPRAMEAGPAVASEADALIALSLGQQSEATTETTMTTIATVTSATTVAEAHGAPPLATMAWDASAAPAIDHPEDEHRAASAEMADETTTTPAQTASSSGFASPVLLPASLSPRCSWRAMSSSSSAATSPAPSTPSPSSPSYI